MYIKTLLRGNNKSFIPYHNYYCHVTVLNNLQIFVKFLAIIITSILKPKKELDFLSSFLSGFVILY